MKIKKNGKPDLNSDDIENYGIHEIEKYFLGHSRITANLTKCDKGQFWDGALFLYKDGGKVKENYVDRAKRNIKTIIPDMIEMLRCINYEIRNLHKPIN